MAIEISVNGTVSLSSYTVVREICLQDKTTGEELGMRKVVYILRRS
jgi:hypothetical protein